MKINAFLICKESIAGITRNSVTFRWFMTFTASMAYVVALVICWMIIFFVAFCAKNKKFLEKGCHTGDHVKMVIVKVQIYFILRFRAAEDDPTGMIL